MFCTNCGKEIKAGSNFCENCGAAVTGQPASAPAPALDPEQVKTPEQTGNSAGTAQKGKQGNLASGIISLAVVGGIILVIVNVGGLLFGNGKDIDAAEKKVLSLVTENYGEIPTVHGEVLKKVDNHVLVAVTFEVEMNGYTLDGSYIVDVRKKSHIAWQWSNELPLMFIPTPIMKWRHPKCEGWKIVWRERKLNRSKVRIRTNPAEVESSAFAGFYMFRTEKSRLCLHHFYTI